MTQSSVLTPPSTAAEPAARPLNQLTDRCDATAIVGLTHGATGRGSCGAQAFMRVVLPSGGELLFCGHHGNEYLPVLTAAGAYVQDDRTLINTKPTDTRASNGF